MVQSRFKVKGDIPTSADHELKISGIGGVVEFGSGITLTGLTKIHFRKGGGKLVVGDGVELRGSYDIGDGSTISLGSASRVNRHCLFVALEGADITLGKECLLSNATIRTCDMHSVLDGEGNRINPSKSIVLEDRVWLAENTYVVKGVTIGCDSVVAANSVVVKSVPANVVVAGNPARVVKSGITWTRKRIPLSP